MNEPRNLLETAAFAYPEEKVRRDYLLATYYMEASADTNVLAQATAIAIGQTVGTWVPVPGVTAEMLAHSLAQVVALYDVPPIELNDELPSGKRSFIIQLAFPEVNFGAQFPMMLTTLLGNDVSTSAPLKLLDIQLSPTLAQGFGGPRFGIKGIRERLGVPQRPLLLNVIKPSTGFPAEQGVAFFEESARGGSDVIKDDELLANPSFNQLALRVRLYHQAALRIYEETGHRTLYCANITDSPERVMDNARRAVELGADMVMVNAIASGFGTVQAVARAAEITIPILTHYATASTLTNNPRYGIASPLLLGKFQRLAGADAASISSPYSAYPQLREKYLRIGQFLRLPLYDLKPTLPVPGGGIHCGTAVKIVSDLGYDVMLAVGGAIQGHPDGAAAGARAVRQAFDAIMEGIPLAEKARTSSELKKSIECWGD